MIVLFYLSVSLVWSQSQGPEKGSSSDIRIQSSADYVFGRSFLFNSEYLGESKKIFIKVPEGYSEGGNRYPVIYILDGTSYFIPFTGVVQYLHSYGMIPGVISVAIESGDRLKEFTYTKADEETGNWPTSGGAESFFLFLSEELIPYIDATYRTHPFRIIGGHSLAGLFAVETLLRHPDLFQTTIAMSPSLYWNQFEWLKKAGDWITDNKSIRHFLFISVEEKEEKQKNYLSQFRKSVEMNAPDSFKYSYTCFPEEDHGSVALPALFTNLKNLFNGWEFPGEAWETGPEKVKEHFQGLSKRYGFPVPIAEDFLIEHAFHGLRQHEAPDEAIRLFEFCLSLYPNSAEAYEGMGEAYEAKGMKGKAREFYKKAVEIDPENKNAKEMLEKLSRNE